MARTTLLKTSPETLTTRLNRAKRVRSGYSFCIKTRPQAHRQRLSVLRTGSNRRWRLGLQPTASRLHDPREPPSNLSMAVPNSLSQARTYTHSLIGIDGVRVSTELYLASLHVALRGEVQLAPGAMIIRREI